MARDFARAFVRNFASVAAIILILLLTPFQSFAVVVLLLADLILLLPTNGWGFFVLFVLSGSLFVWIFMSGRFLIRLAVDPSLARWRWRQYAPRQAGSFTGFYSAVLAMSPVVRRALDLGTP